MRIWFPAAVSRAEVGEPSTPPGDDGGAERVLVVEDDELVRDFVCRALEEAGYAIVVAASGDGAMEVLRLNGMDVDLVLTDVVMPGMSGPELAERMTLLAPDTPVLFMSGYIDSSFLGAELHRRPESLLRKPFSAVELRQRVRRALDQRGVARPTES